MPDNSFPIAQETEIFLLAVLLGAGLGAVFEFTRILRAIFPHGKILTFIEDFVFVLICGFSVFTFSVGLTGSIRWFTIVGLIAGCTLERLTIGNAVLFIIRKFSQGIRNKLIIPICRFIAKICRKVYSQFVKKCLNFCKKKKSVEKPLKVDF